ncbi:DUF188 domain-containing protein [Bacillus tianshenii]|nr:DUF188 domain-containing protein [Bacillus tianshenii]
MRRDVEIEKYDESMCTIFVDADACPVKKDIVEIAAAYHCSVIFISSYNHMIHDKPGGEWVFVDTNQEEVDLYIVNHVKPYDLVITQDIGLAGLLLKRNVYVLSPRGKEYNEANIEPALFSRFVHAKQRQAGQKTRGPKAYTKQDKEHFRVELEKILSNLAGI